MGVLPDVLEPRLKVVFCGTAVGPRSAELGLYYAGRGNRFWEVLLDIGLTPRKLSPQQFRQLRKYGIGLSDLVKSSSGIDESVSSKDFEIDAFRAKVQRFAPLAIAFNGKKAAKKFFERSSVHYGPQAECVGQTAIFVLPSTSAMAAGYWDEWYWQQLADSVRHWKGDKR